MKRTHTSVYNRKIELSNLEKILFPEDQIIKAELIEYYLKVAPTILRHVKGRPLSFVRYPDGTTGQAFFQKNRPEWAPDWIKHVTLGGGESKIDYILATEEACLVWFANLACIELHQIHGRLPHLDRPDYMVFDLDPPEKYRFTRVIEIALDLKEHIERLGYHTFVKTTGGKGLHVVVPIEPRWPTDKVFEAISAIAKPFVQQHSTSTTLQIKKDARKGKVLVDIYRNRFSQTIVSPYSVRGRANGPVSMPIGWDELLTVTDPSVFHLRMAIDRLVKGEDAWEAMDAYAVQLHTERKPSKARKRPQGGAKAASSLQTYAGKRSFDKTPEPPPDVGSSEGNAFCIHRHHASRLHYDIRLEQEGTLKCWAVPKGLPPRPGIKRLAVATEDHPLRYLTFEGTIPKKEYGGGRMWIYASGKYEITKNKPDSFYFRLRSPEINAEYRLIHTRNKDWLLERVDRTQIDWLRDFIDPMLASSRPKPPESPDYMYEVKWDGIRALISLDEGALTIRSRNKRDLGKYFPELLVPEQAFRASSAVFDAEIVCLDSDGKPIFDQAIRRLRSSSESAIARARAKHPAVCYIFDCLYLDGRPIVHEPLTKRREWMADAVRSDSPYRVSEAVNEGARLFEAAVQMGLEGIMAKERASLYHPGRRSEQWIKIKGRQTMECVALGYTKGKGDRASLFGAIQLGRYQRGIRGKDHELKYVGKVGTGFDERLLESVALELQKIPKAKRLIDTKPPDDSQTIWLEPRVVCEVRYASLTSAGTLREPVFVRLRPDLDPEDI